MKSTQLLAQISNPVLKYTMGNNSSDPSAGTNGIAPIITGIASFLLIVSTLYCFFLIIIGGLSWISSDGDKAGLEKARNKITHAVLGLIIVASAWAITTLVSHFLGIDFGKMPFPTLGK